MNGPDSNDKDCSFLLPPGVNAGPNTAFGGKGRKRPSLSST